MWWPEVLQRVSSSSLWRHEHFWLTRKQRAVLELTIIVRNRRDLVWNKLLKHLAWCRRLRRRDTLLDDSRRSRRKNFSNV